MERKCSNCALKALKNGMCPIFNANMEEELGCPYFSTHVNYCDICGSAILRGTYLCEENDIVHFMCSDCATGNPCARCVKHQECRFQSDKSCTEPPYVMVRRQQGNAIVQTQVLNRKRVEATCAQGCPCFRPEGMEDGCFCFKQEQCGCNNLINNWRN